MTVAKFMNYFKMVALNRWRRNTACGFSEQGPIDGAAGGDGAGDGELDEVTTRLRHKTILLETKVVREALEPGCRRCVYECDTRSGSRLQKQQKSEWKWR